ncbi:MAG: hypothetical protein Q7O66_10405 [Dehalococcoidia bacterium]|nr:hypothetical protein [Dehalococcoidia bacterium]
MNHLKTRAIVASEYPERRHWFAGVVQDELGGVVVGEAESAVGALALARTLRPDLMMVDHSLPYVTGVDGVRLSRIGGLDAALSVVQDLPRARVLLVRCNGAALAPDNGSKGRMELCLYQRADPDSGQLEQQVTFAALREKAMPALRRKVMAVSEKGMLVGGLGMLGGLGLMFTILLASAGVVLLAAGGAVILLSLCTSAAAATWPTRGRSGVVHAKIQGERDDIQASLQRMPVI